MLQFNINLRSIEDVKNFVTAASMVNCDIDVLSGRYLVDAKSIMGLFSLDLNKPVTVQVHGDAEAAESFRQAIAQLIAE